MNGHWIGLEIFVDAKEPTLKLGDKPPKPTLLIQGHYDVQPVHPADQSDKPPFDPGIEDGGFSRMASCAGPGAV